MQKKKINGKKVLLISVLVVLVLASAAVLFVGNFLVNYAIGRSGDGGNRQVALKVDEKAVAQTADARTQHREEQAELTRAFYENVEEETITIKSDDGLTLKAGYYAQDSHKWAILVHGYRGYHLGMLNYAQRYHDAGYQIIAPDLRGCGESEGDFVGMGWPDRLDMLKWMDWILERDPEAQIVMHGVSMGAATVMMTSGEKLPEAVKAIVEDCGYTSVWDIFSSELELRFHLPTFPVLYAASAIAKVRAGFDFNHASSVEQVKKCSTPMLFIHGDQDNFVPFDMLQVVYDACPAKKEMIVVPGAGHGASSTVLGQEYWDATFAFLDKYVNIA